MPSGSPSLLKPNGEKLDLALSRSNNSTDLASSSQPTEENYNVVLCEPNLLLHSHSLDNVL